MDTIITIISNVNLELAFKRSFGGQEFEYHITAGSADDSYTRLGNGLKAKLFVSDIDNWGSLHILNRSIDYIGQGDAFPNPFYIGDGERVFIPVNISDEIELKIYSISLNLVYNRKVRPKFLFGNYLVEWDGRDNSGNFVNTGVYFYHISHNGEDRTGKLIVIRR
jgi:hypothetical protein